MNDLLGQELVEGDIVAMGYKTQVYGGPIKVGIILRIEEITNHRNQPINRTRVLYNGQTWVPGQGYVTCVTAYTFRDRSDQPRFVKLNQEQALESPLVRMLVEAVPNHM